MDETNPSAALFQCGRGLTPHMALGIGIVVKQTCHEREVYCTIVVHVELSSPEVSVLCHQDASQRQTWSGKETPAFDLSRRCKLQSTTGCVCVCASTVFARPTRERHNFCEPFCGHLQSSSLLSKSDGVNVTGVRRIAVRAWRQHLDLKT